MIRLTWRTAFTTCIVGSALALSGCGGDDDGENPDDGTAGSNGAAGSSSTGGSGSGAQCSATMFDKYGEAAFLAVRDSVVTRALAAPTDKLGDSFQSFATNSSPAQIDRFKDNLAAFLVMVYGGPSGYQGRTMQAAHAGLNITSDEYDYFVTEVVVPALAENGVPAADISECFAPPLVDESFKASIVGQ